MVDLYDVPSVPAPQESYVTYEDRLRLVGEIISILGAMAILLLEVSRRRRSTV